MDDKIEEAVQKCNTCQMFTNKTVKEPIASHTIPAASWESVSIYLFGPMPDHKHVLVVTDLSSRFPAAKVVSSTAANP